MPNSPNRVLRPCVLCVMFAAAVLPLLTACRTGPDPALAGPEYPASIQRGPTVDLQVVRDETTITMTNTTAEAFGPSRLWINRYYSLPIDGLGVGETITRSLWDFRDEHGEAFEAGGFFATRRPEPLVQAELETDGRMVGLIVVSRPTE